MATSPEDEPPIVYSRAASGWVPHGNYWKQAVQHLQRRLNRKNECHGSKIKPKWKTTSPDKKTKEDGTQRCYLTATCLEKIRWIIITSWPWIKVHVDASRFQAHVTWWLKSHRRQRASDWITVERNTTNPMPIVYVSTTHVQNLQQFHTYA